MVLVANVRRVSFVRDPEDADIVMQLDVGSLAGVAMSRFDDVRIQRTLCQELGIFDVG